MRGFLDTLPEGEDEYIEGVRQMCEHLYQEALADSGKQYFLDKTPRYYFIISELFRTFPRAHYIILFRNPLAVLCSVLRTWMKDDRLWLFYLSKFGCDLVQAPHLLVEGKEVVGKQGIVVHYEDLVKNPGDEVCRICDQLHIRFYPEMVEYGARNVSHWHLGDQHSIYRHDRPVQPKADHWTNELSDSQVWRLAKDYLQLLDEECLGKMGYRLKALQKTMEAQRPSRIEGSFTFSLSWLLGKRLEDRKKWERELMRLGHRLHRSGVKGTIGRAVCKISLS